MSGLSNLWTRCLAVLMGAAMVAGDAAQTDPSAASPILGFYRMELGEGWHAVGPPLAPFAALRGVAKGLQMNQLAIQSEDEARVWQVNQWAGYELCVGGGAASGRRYAIQGNDGEWLALGGEPASDGLRPGDAVSILPTLAEYFGDQLVGGEGLAADWVAVYYQNSLMRMHRNAGGQWVDDGNRPVRLSVASGSGLLLNLLPGKTGGRSLLLTGEWSGTPSGSYVGQGRQIISAPLAGGPLLLGQTFTGPGPKAGATLEESDQLSVVTDPAGDFRTCWLDRQGRWRWLDTGEEAGGLPLEPGRGYIYYHTGEGFNWRWR